MGFCIPKKKIREIIKISRIFFGFCGAEGFRTLVQLCDKVCFLRACFPINCRERTGWKPTLSFSLGALSRFCITPYKNQLCYFDAPDSNLTRRQLEEQKLSVVLN